MASQSFTLSELADDLLRQAQALADVDATQAIDRCRVAIVASVKENFAGNHSPDGQPWKGLLFPRVRSKGKDMPLRDRGILMASVTSTAGEKHVEEITRTTLEMGTALDYAAVHQDGGTIYPKKGKFLAVPRTIEAYRAGSPRRFPRPLSFAVGKKGGVMFEIKQTGRGKSKKAQRINHYMLLLKAVIPQREFLGFSQQLQDRIEEIIADWYEEQVTRG